MAPLRVHYARGIDCASWERHHAAGEAADRWPYGLHHLREHGIEIAQAPARAQPLVRLGRRLVGGYDWDRLLTGGDAALCWDERPGVPVALSGVPTLTGVIWLTEPDRRHPTDVLARRALRRSTVFVNSRPQVTPLIAEWGVPSTRVEFVPFGVDVDFWRPQEGARRGLLVLGNDRHRDHETAIRAAQGAGAPLTLVTSLPVSVPHISYLSHSQLRSTYAAHAVVAVATSPNRHASGLTALLEAMSCARPVVVTRGGGLEDYVTPETGVLVDAGDHVAMADAVRVLLADPARAHAMGEAGRASVEECFSTSRMARDLAELVRGLP